jgi:hypothetical protein
MTQAPWYTFPRIDNFGMLDPQPGTGWKPDSNVQIPGYYPVTALNSGTVTSLQQTGFGQAVITIKLDSPFNSLATHEFYEHLSSWDGGITVGQHVASGQLIGYNNPPGQVPLGFGLYPGDVYGSGPAYAQLQADLAPGGKGLLNPVKLLDAAKNGTILSGTGASTASTTSASSPNPLLDPIGAFWASAAPTLKQWGEYAAIFLIAIVLIIIGFVVLGGQQAVGAAKAVTS